MVFKKFLRYFYCVYFTRIHARPIEEKNNAYSTDFYGLKSI